MQLVENLLLTERILPELDQCLHSVLFPHILSDVFAFLPLKFIDEQFDEAIEIGLAHGSIDQLGRRRSLLLRVRGVVGSSVVLLFDLVLVLAGVFGALHANSLLLALPVILLLLLWSPTGIS